MDLSLSGLVGTEQASLGYASALAMSLKVAGWMQAQGFIETVIHLMLGGLVIYILATILRQIALAISTRLGDVATALFTALLVYLSVSIVIAMRGGAYHLINGIASPLVGFILFASFTLVASARRNAVPTPKDASSGTAPGASRGYTSNTATTILALAMLAIPVTYMSIGRGLIEARGVIGVPMPDRNDLDHTDPETYLFRTWTMRLLAKRNLQPAELQRLGMTADDAAMLSDPTGQMRSDLQARGVPALLTGPLARIGGLVVGLPNPSGFTFLGLAGKNYSFLQGFLMGTLPFLSFLSLWVGALLLILSLRALLSLFSRDDQQVTPAAATGPQAAQDPPAAENPPTTPVAEP